MSIASSLKSKFNLGGASSIEDTYSNNNPTIIAKDLSLVGDMNGDGVIEIEGNFKGTIQTKSVIIREDGVVDGSIISDFLHIKGAFKGEIKAKNIAIFEGAQVKGLVEYESISVEDGACLDAQFKIVAS